MTERAFVSRSTGPVVLGLSLPVGGIRVQVLDSLTAARVLLRTADSSGPAADAVEGARITENGQTIAVEVPEMVGDVMVRSVRGHRITQSMGTVYGSVTGMTIVNGRVVSGGGLGTLNTVSPIEAVVSLPAHSSLAVVSTSADARVNGEVDRMEFRSTSGDLQADGVRSLSASSTSGDLVVRRVAGQMTARSVSGDIAVDLYSGTYAELNTTSGDVNVHATSAASGTLRAETVSGDVRVSGGSALKVSAHSVSGDVRTR
ncbi:DUF4097 family beta strand repeat-containing protein [Streptomyces sp. H27-D2]|uniref:DUF4097 family beta strand repeat-containing protein n=1 Tax=Streptomyces sp. H27-D2 TaxID=3046304 RepID=UPI002DBD3AD9|nr:DUF4097 family beta strand repeat-containing protein [Streptomyces sp. H27-D2]MEC4014928.1 DUF4097 family beta strand repeat-containing protein [Streptomyces sp. H27-D2]